MTLSPRIGPPKLNFKSSLRLRLGDNPIKISSPLLSVLLVKKLEVAPEIEPSNLGPPSLVTIFTTPLIARPYSALNVPVMTSKSWTASGCISTAALPPPNDSSTCTPSTMYVTSVFLPPRKWPFTTPACILITFPIFSTGSASISSLDMFFIVPV